MKCKQTKSPAQFNFQMHSHFDRQNTTHVSPFNNYLIKRTWLSFMCLTKNGGLWIKKIIWYKLSYSIFKKIRTDIWEVSQQFVRMMADRKKYLRNYFVFMQMYMDINKINDQSEILSSTLSPFFFLNPTYLHNLKSRTKFSIRCNIKRTKFSIRYNIF